jgi:hypothetical protein
MAQLVVSWFICDGRFRVHAINAVGRRRARIIEIEDIDSGERFHGSPRKLQRLSHANPAPSPYLVWLAPAIPKAGVALDLVEGRVEGTKLVSDTLDHGPHVRPIAIGPASVDEAHIVRQRAQARANARWWVLNSSRR